MCDSNKDAKSCVDLTPLTTPVYLSRLLSDVRGNIIEQMWSHRVSDGVIELHYHYNVETCEATWVLKHSNGVVSMKPDGTISEK